MDGREPPRAACAEGGVETSSKDGVHLPATILANAETCGASISDALCVTRSVARVLHRIDRTEEAEIDGRM
jgi:hypothetical protein